jgi:hypothetical protein
MLSLEGAGSQHTTSRRVMHVKGLHILTAVADAVRSNLLDET